MPQVLSPHLEPCPRYCAQELDCAVPKGVFMANPDIFLGNLPASTTFHHVIIPQARLEHDRFSAKFHVRLT